MQFEFSVSQGDWEEGMKDMDAVSAWLRVSLQGLHKYLLNELQLGGGRGMELSQKNIKREKKKNRKKHKNTLDSELPEDRSHVSNQCFHPHLIAIACAANTTGIGNKEQEAQQTNGILLQDWLHLLL